MKRVVFMSGERVCFVCQTRIADNETTRRFEREERTITVHLECLQLLGDLLKASLEDSETLEKIGVQTVRDKILALVQRDTDGRFTIASEQVYKLAAREAIATVLYIEARPLSSQELYTFLMRCYKKVPPKSISIYLTARDPKTSIRLYLRRTNGEYELNTAGKRWFETRVAPKILRD